MNILGISQKHEPTETGFWVRQVDSEVTAGQTIFDVTFGIVAPVLCFVFDLIVFQTRGFGPPIYPQYQLPVYLFSGLQILILIGWLLSAGSFRTANGVIGGALSIGGLFCFICGFVLLPFSLLGLAMVIGIFGFTPFLCGVVFFRNGIRAWNGSQSGESGARVHASPGVGFGARSPDPTDH